MRRRWEVTRTTIVRPDAQQRWDAAYQLLVRQLAPPPRSTESAAPCVREDDHGYCPVRARVDDASTADADN
jgi:hypothetical protein